MDKVKIWNDFINELKNKVSDVTFNTWFINLKLLTINDKDIVIIVPYSVHKNHIINNYMDIIEEIFLNITGKNLNIVFCLEGEYKENTLDNIEKIGLDDSVIENFVEARKTNLNPKYTFDNFVVGDSNRFAFSSCLSVAQNPGKLYNPLFLYGKSGLGKTHLMHAIGNYIVQNTNLRVLYITTDEFMNEFISITRDSGNKEDNFNYIDIFKEKYRDVDVLMIDDIQFLGSANATQQEFTNTFNSLYYKEKQIIICSDRSVDDLKMFADRLRTRFNWGLKAIISVPEFDLKVKIIKNKIKTSDLAIDLSEEIIDFMASNCGSDVRNLEGMITRLAAYSAICNIKNYTLETAMEALDEYVNGMGQYTVNSIGKIINIVSQYFKLTPDDLKGKKRSKDIANARMIAMYLCRILTDETYPRIGLEFGGRDHSTVIHAYEKINEDIKNNGELEKIISELKLKMSE
ncbi:MAG TPA: chromosomal replication initiator protein DnaA [Firmicutes bacterium]|jgi:chromosomal replication initiator protein|nr:chromosomal replication initiator protein DnaA [Bacillota bacterium]